MKHKTSQNYCIITKKSNNKTMTVDMCLMLGYCPNHCLCKK